MATVKCFTLKRNFALAIMRSEKLIEARPGEKKYENLPDGGLIKWHWYKKERLVTRLVRKTKFNSIKEMLTSVGVQVYVPGKTMEQALVSQWQVFQMPMP